MTTELKTDLTIKIIVLGSSEVGKTCILNRYFNNEFKENKIDVSYFVSPWFITLFTNTFPNIKSFNDI